MGKGKGPKVFATLLSQAKSLLSTLPRGDRSKDLRNKNRKVTYFVFFRSRLCQCMCWIKGKSL